MVFQLLFFFEGVERKPVPRRKEVGNNDLCSV